MKKKKNMAKHTVNTGQLGRVAVIGGSEDYTGAPYFSAMASARLGCDMVRSIASLLLLQEA